MLMFMGIEQVGGCPARTISCSSATTWLSTCALMDIEWFAHARRSAAVVARPWSIAGGMPQRPSDARSASHPRHRRCRDARCFAAMLVASSLPYTGAPISLQAAERVAFGLVPLAYLVGLFRARLGRVGVSDLIVELGRRPRARTAARRTRPRAARPLARARLLDADEPDEYVDVDGDRSPSIRRLGDAVTILERHGRRGRGPRPRRRR